MDRDTEIINFALKWRHWGGGSESDIFVEFGIPSIEYFCRLTDLLDRGALANQPERIVRQIREICQIRKAESMARTASSVRERSGARRVE